MPPYRILAVTFTNKAAGEMKHRLRNLIGDDLTKSLWVGTFHALSARLIRTFHAEVGLSKNFVIYDDADQKAVMNRVVKELGLDDKRYPPRQLLSKVHKEKQEGRRSQDFIPGNYFDDVFRRVYEAYEKRLLEANAVDFEDLLLDGMRLAESKERAGVELRRKFRYVLVDEFQDVNQVQYRFVRALTAESRNLCVVGDDDQSIYRWRGADVQIVRNFRHDYPDATIIKLEQNYRSSGRIVDAALGVIKPARDREPKELWTENHPGELVRVVATSSERDEAALVVGRVKELIDGGVSPSEIALFYRVHAQSRVLEEVMRASQIAYQIVGGTRFFERAEIKDVLSYLRVLSNPKSDVDLERIINVPPRKIGKSTITLLAEQANREGSSLLEALVPLTQGSVLGTAAKKALIKFRELIIELTVVAKTAPPSELAQTVLELTGYRTILEQDETDESDARLGNLDEFVGSIAEYEEEAASAGEVPSLDSYLERVTLSAGLDELKGRAQGGDDDRPRRQGPGVLLRDGDRDGGRHLPLQEPRSGPQAGRGGGAPPGLCRLHPRPPRAAHHPRGETDDLRHHHLRYPQPIHRQHPQDGGETRGHGPAQDGQRGSLHRPRKRRPEGVDWAERWRLDPPDERTLGELGSSPSGDPRASLTETAGRPR